MLQKPLVFFFITGLPLTPHCILLLPFLPSPMCLSVLRGTASPKTAQQVFEMGVWVDGISGVIAFLDYWHNHFRA